jgi:Transaldolase/Fructose-6-phosphate aldolase
MDAELNPAQRLHALGQSLWLDSINRVMLRTGTLARYVRDLAVTGLTSNPTILGHAMAAGSDYDRSLARLAGEGVVMVFLIGAWLIFFGLLQTALALRLRSATHSARSWVATPHGAV